jgi:hypothetical protein
MRVGEKVNNLEAGAMQMMKKTLLAKALDAMSCIPCVRFPVHVDENTDITITGVNAGTPYDPKVDIILEKSTPSSFGRGTETVLDPSYRNGREIPAADIEFGNIENQVLFDVQRFMFPGREVKLKLYKLAVYESGGHFDWHMDTTHSDKHHGTLLLALNTSWTGGNLILRRNGIETTVDLHPQHPYRDWTMLGVVAFFTDTEHCVEPVESGVRIVLQYDIELAKKEEEGGHEEDKEADEENEDEKVEDDEEDEETEEFEAEKLEPWMKKVREVWSERAETDATAQAIADKAALEKVVSTIKAMHSKGAEEVAFALQHLYRRTSILAEYLKGSDATLYNALLASGDFDISLHPVILSEESDYEGTMEEHYVYRYDDIEVDRDDSESPPPKKKKKVQRPEFHIPKLSGLVEISKQEYVEHTGNEAMPAKYRYFGGGMFVRPKAK